MRIGASLSRALWLGLLATGCASAPPAVPTEVVRIGPGCRALTIEAAPSAFVDVGRVSADVPFDADQRWIDERLSGPACSLGADAILRDGAEPLIPNPTLVERPLQNRWALNLSELGPPSLGVREQRVFGRAIRFLK